MIFSMEAVQEYFRNHLERGVWQEFSGTLQSAAVTTAQGDVKMATGQDPLDLSDLLIFSAVCEQALFVAKRAAAERQTPAYETKLKSETIEGVGRREYFETVQTTASALSGELAPRAALFLSRHPAFRSLNLSRG